MKNPSVDATLKTKVTYDIFLNMKVMTFVGAKHIAALNKYKDLHTIDIKYHDKTNPTIL